MRKEWVEQTKDGHLTYCISEDNGEMYLPVCWKDADDFYADLNKATQAAFGVDFEFAQDKTSMVDNFKFWAAWSGVIITKMRAGR